MVEKLQLGTPDTLAFTLQLDASQPEGLVWGQMEVFLAGQPLWYQHAGAEENPKPVHWTWVDLLLGLGRIWPWLFLEEGYPLPITPEHPGQMLQTARHRWQNLAQGQAEVEEDRLFDFRQRHDLSMLLRGIHLPPLWMIREGQQMLVWSPDATQPVRLPLQQIQNLLQQLGDAICAGLQSSPDSSRSATALKFWNDKESKLKQKLLEITTSLTLEELVETAGLDTPDIKQLEHFFELEITDATVPASTELLAAARMTVGRITPEDQKYLLNLIKNQPATPSRALDMASKACYLPDEALPPWEQGYHLAAWLRAYLNLEDTTPIDPEQLLHDWFIPLHQFTLDAPIDALAVWGTRHGPAIWLNQSPNSRSSTTHGQRTTLAHEICHLLIDRQASLPLVEVLGGNVPRFAEKRANAFAAELLLPRAATEQQIYQSNDLATAIQYLEHHYQVSKELIRHQIFNSGCTTTLSPKDLRLLDSLALNS